MEEFLLYPLTILAALLSIIILWSINNIFLHPSNNKKLPPSPLKLPIIGNLHQLGSLPHRNLHSLAQKHGPLMLLHFGSIPCLIASSADSAREIMKTHDLIFASRPVYKVFSKLLYNGRDVASAPYGEYWRKMKSVIVLHLLSNKRVQTFRSIMEEETALFVKKIEESKGPVNLSKMFSELSNDGICRAAFGRKYSKSENGKRFLLLISDFMEMLARFNVGDLIPALSWISRVNGVDKKMDNIAKKVDEVLESVIQERMESRDFMGNSGENFVDIMLEICNGKNSDFNVDRDSIKALILDVFIGGTDTISTALEWIMTELLLHPKAMKELQREIRGIMIQKQVITDDDLEKMHYLKAVIKEASRVHPPIPLIVPRLARRDVQVKGYDISAGTVVIVNAWAIGKDPISWNEPDKFKPERFLNSSIDYRGFDFELIPFGAGRRGCPGITFAVATIELVLANMVHRFDWELVEGKDVDMNESPGVTVHRAVPLLALATPSIT